MRKRLLTPATLVVALGSLVLAAGCWGRIRIPPLGSAPPPFPNILTTSRTDQVTYARSLTYMSTSPYMDAQYLTTIRGIDTTVGPYATNEPVRDAALYDVGDYTTGRFTSRINADAAYPELGLEQGVNYVWVQQEPAGWFFLLVPDDTTRPLKRIGAVRTPPSAPEPWYMPVARFVRPRGAGPTMIWEPCPDNACCDAFRQADGFVRVDTLR